MKDPNDQLNVVWIYCDELRADALQCYGNPHARMQTPHMDEIAEKGVCFTHFFCNSPVCVPSRMSMLTGLYPEDTGVYHNEAAYEEFSLSRPCITFPEVFAAHGYQTASFGKEHLPKSMAPWQTNNPKGKENLVGFLEPGEGDLIRLCGEFDSIVGGRFPSEKPFPPTKILENAMEWISQVDDPFLVRLSYLQPHTPVIPLAPFDKLYDPGCFPDTVEIKGTPSSFERRFAGIVSDPPMSPEHLQLARAHYYGMVAWIDTQVGKLMAFLRETKKLDRTIIVLTSDHGVSLGENGCYGKHIFAPQSHRIPLLVSAPHGNLKKSVCSDLGEGVDFPRTLLGLAQLETPDSFKERDLFSSKPPEAVFGSIGFGLPDSKAFPNRKVGTYLEGSGWPRRSCVRTARYRLDKNVLLNGQPVLQDDEDLFLVDTVADPSEIQNLASQDSCQSTVQYLSGLLDKHREECGPAGS